MIKIRFTKTGVLGIGKNELREVGRKAMGAVGFYWWKNYLPIHFKKTAYLRYRYEKRLPGYQKRKKAGAKNSEGIRAIRENLPLVYTGRTRRSALSRPNVVNKAPNFKTYETTITMHTPVLNFNPEGNSELTRVTAQEYGKMEKVFSKNYERQLNKVGRTNKKTKTI